MSGAVQELTEETEQGFTAAPPWKACTGLPPYTLLS